METPILVSLLKLFPFCFQTFSSSFTSIYILGGEDFDQRVMEHFIKLYKKKKGKDLRKDNRAVQKLRREVEKAKRALSAAHQVTKCQPFLFTLFLIYLI